MVDIWEDADTEDLERRMEERKNELKTTETIVVKPAEATRVETGTSETDSQFVSTLDPRLKIQDSERTQYVAPVKILKRQEAGSPQALSSPNPPSEESKKYKTLAEREAAYASARARILGGPPCSGGQDIKLLSNSQSPSDRQC